MFKLFNSKRRGPIHHPAPSGDPPGWAPAPEQSHQWGLDDAPEHEFEEAERFCQNYPPDSSKLLASDVVERIDTEGCNAWGMELPCSNRFVGKVSSSKKGGKVVEIETEPSCKDVSVLSDLPLMAGLYDIQGKIGVYYEVMVHQMEGVIAMGMACRPYPVWRLPGWNRLSAAFHLDDLRKFFEDPDGGRDYTDQISRISPGDVIGCGYEFNNGNIFYTYNGCRLPIAFSGVYLPRENHDVYVALGVGGPGKNKLEVNFGGELFKWSEGNDWAWRVEGHVGRLTGSSRAYDDELPTYDEARRG